MSKTYQDSVITRVARPRSKRIQQIPGIASGSPSSPGVTSVALTMPDGFNVEGSPVTQSGELRVAFLEGYSLLTPEARAILDLFEYDSETHTLIVKKDGTTPVNFAAWGEVTAGGPGEGGDTPSGALYSLVDVYHSGVNVLRADGTARQNGDALVFNTTQNKWVASPVSGGASSFAQLTGSPYDNTSLATALNGKVNTSVISDMATQTWVNGQGFLTGINSTMVVDALGYTPYNAANIGSASVASASYLAKNAGTSTMSVLSSSWDGAISEGTAIWRESFKDTSISDDTGDLVLKLRAGVYSGGSTELCVCIDGDYYAMGHKVWHGGNANNSSTPWTCSNLTASGNATFGGNVGIGTTSPISALNVSTAGNSNGCICVNSTSSSVDRMFAAYAPNLSSGNKIVIYFEKGASTYNAGYFGYVWNASGSVNNYLTLGFWGADNLVRIYGNGSLVTSGHIELANAGGTGSSTATQNYISCGTGYSNGSGYNGIKLAICHQSDACSGFGQDLSGISGGYDLSIATSTNSSGYGIISFNKHQNASSSYTNLGYIDNNANLVMKGEVTAGSDKRWKEHIRTIAHNPIMELTPCEWDWKEGHGNGHSAGLIAQQVAAYLPFAVKGNEDDGYTLNYNVFHAYEISAIQSHETRIQQLERENAELKRMLKLNSYKV